MSTPNVRKKPSRPTFRVRPASNQFTADSIKHKHARGTPISNTRRAVSQLKTRDPSGPELFVEHEAQDGSEFRYSEHVHGETKGLLTEAHVGDKFSCMCSVCYNAPLNQIRHEDPNKNFDFFQEDYDETANMDPEKDFNFIMRRLQPPKHVQRALRLFVPDTAIFLGGEIRYIVTTGKVTIFLMSHPNDKTRTRL